MREADVSVRRNVTRWIVVALLAAALAFGPVATSPAEAATKAKLTFTTEKVKVAGGSCGGQVVKIKVPVLKGSTKANQARVAEWSKWMKKSLAKMPDRGCDALARAEGSVYKDRYLSVVMDLYAWETRSLNLDLKTGKTVTLSKFVSNKADVFDFARCEAAATVWPYVADYGCAKDYPGVHAWRVTSKGIRVYSSYEGEPGDFLVPWSHIVKPGYKKQKKQVTKNVPTQWYYRDTVKPANTKVTVQGNLVTVQADGRSYYGTRGLGTVESSGKLAWVTVFAPGEWDQGKIRHVAFSSKSSNKAVRYTSNIG